jgi:signal transduction histidine kinase
MILIRLWNHKDKVILKIQDNGLGFEAMPTMYNGGMGLKIMKERAEALGGDFQIISSPGKGTTILVEVLYDKAHSIVDSR